MFSRRKSFNSYFSLLASIVLFTSSCQNDLPANPQLTTSSQIQEKSIQDKLLEELEVINTKLDNLTETKSKLLPTVVTPTATSATTTVPTGITPTIIPTGTTPTNAPTAIPTPTVADPLSKGRKILDLIMNTFKTAPGIEAEVSEYEKNLKSGKEVQNELKIYTSPAKLVKMEVMSSSTGNTGVKLLYTSGDSGKVKLRPNGVLSLVTTDLNKDDDRIVHQNGYKLDYTDFHGMISRFSDPNYQAELTGKTSISGLTIYILKVTHKTQNTLDQRIIYENIGFDSKDYSVRLWEAYEKTSKDPFIKFTLKSLALNASIPESVFKI